MEKMSLNLEQQELEKCKLALELYALSRREYSEDSRPLDNFDKRMIEGNASLLVKDDGDGLRIGGPMSENIKFRYGVVRGVSEEKIFYLDSNDVSDSDPDFQKFQKIVADKFTENNIPFYSVSA
jgi:hypothetical protein